MGNTSVMGLIRFETFTLDLAGKLLKQGERQVALRRQPFKVLAYLAEHPGRLVTNNELIEACWENPKRTSVNSLAQCIKAIREALGEADQEIIRTVHGQGYVFAAQVSIMADSIADERPEPAKPSRLHLRSGLSLGRWRALAAAIVVMTVLFGGVWEVRSWLARPTEPDMMAVPSIAVLPFEAIDEDSRKVDAGALTEDVTTELTRMPRGYSLRIRSTSGSNLAGVPLRGVGRQLGLRFPVPGTLPPDGHGPQVQLQLIESE